jgi:hypothetical protein
MADQAINDQHYQDMKYLQTMRDDVVAILRDTIERHYDYPPADEAGMDAEREKLREDLHQVIERVERTLNGL